jgi:hypothetical protein
MAKKHTRLALLASLLVVLVGACSGSSDKNGGIGDTCGGNSDCGTNLYCYQHATASELEKFVGQCTVSCDVSFTTGEDSCKKIDPNSECLVAGFCARECNSSGLGCPEGTHCDTNEHCVRGN